jgi:hypothetical protein
LLLGRNCNTITKGVIIQNPHSQVGPQTDPLRTSGVGPRLQYFSARFEKKWEEPPLPDPSLCPLPSPQPLPRLASGHALHAWCTQNSCLSRPGLTPTCCYAPLCLGASEDYLLMFPYLRPRSPDPLLGKPANCPAHTHLTMASL